MGSPDLEPTVMEKARHNGKAEAKPRFYRVGLLALALIALAAAVGLWGDDFYAWAKVLVPICFTLPTWLFLRWTYLWLRHISYKQRNKRWENDPAEKIEKPQGTTKPEDYHGVKVLHDAQWKYIPEAALAQGSYFSNGILTAVLSPMALLLLSLQTLIWPEGGWWSVGAIFGEVLCLLTLVILALLFREPTAEWVENRIRTELFRREQYLALAGVGPYLGMDEIATPEEAIRRSGEIDSANAQDLIRLIPMQAPRGITWIESLHRMGEGGLTGRGDCVARMQSYLYYRIDKQIQWFANSARDNKENDRRWTALLVGALCCAILLGCVHAGHLLLEAHRSAGPNDHRELWVVAVGVLGIVLPPLGTACVSIQNMYDFHGRSRIYMHEKSLLKSHKSEMEALLFRAKHLQQIQTFDHHRDKIDFEFRTIVLRTEHSLSVEMEQWLLLMEKDEIEAAA